MATHRKRGVCILSFSLGSMALPVGLMALVYQGSRTGVALIVAGMALLIQGLRCLEE